MAADGMADIEDGMGDGIGDGIEGGMGDGVSIFLIISDWIRLSIIVLGHHRYW